MSPRVRFTPSGRAQFLAALQYIAADHPTAVADLRERAVTRLGRLADFPESGRMLPGFPDLPFREVVIAPYRFFHRLKGDTVWAVAWHGVQLPDAPSEAGRG